MVELEVPCEVPVVLMYYWLDAVQPEGQLDGLAQAQAFDSRR
jgi:hypothetical protein